MRRLSPSYDEILLPGELSLPALSKSPIRRAYDVTLAIASTYRTVWPTAAILASTVGLSPFAMASVPADVAANDLKTVSSVTTLNGSRFAYDAVIGTLPVKANADPDGSTADGATADMSFVAYSTSPAAPKRPIVFIFNGGPGSSSVWLHMGAFGPKHVSTPDPAQVVRPPYALVQNPDCLLDVADIVFVDAPGTGFGKLSGKSPKRAFFGVDADVSAFAGFIAEYLQRFDRQDSPLFLFGESYGTTRAAILADELEERRRIRVSGVILMSQALNFDLLVDHASGNPGSDLPYVLGLPSYTATAYYHHKLPGAGNVALPQLLAQVEAWTKDVYLPALMEGASLSPARRNAVIAQLHNYTGLPSGYIDRSNLRIEAGAFLQELGAEDGVVYGRLDTRYSGPTMDSVEEEVSYDPQTANIAAAYQAGWYDYARHDLKLNPSIKFIQQVDDAWTIWNWRHIQPNVNEPVPGALNAMADLAAAMEFNPGLKVMLNSGYFDVATPFFQSLYELKHLPMPSVLQANISTFQYRSGHKIFVDPASLDALHANISSFIRSSTSGGS